MDQASAMNFNRNSRSFTEDFSVNVFSVNSYPPIRSDTEASDEQKAGPTLLCSGVFLGLVGMTFTVMAWINYDRNTVLPWTQLLGPILLAFGVFFILIGLCKFKNSKCKSWIGSDDQPVEVDQIPSGQSFVFTGINQPITFHGATVLQYIPPPCGIGTNECSVVNSNQSNGFELPGVACPPQYNTIYPHENPSFLGDGNNATSLPVAYCNSREHACDGTKNGKTVVEETPCSAPPAYEDIFPNHPLRRTV